MAHYFFDMFDGRELIEDAEGQELAGAGALLSEATEVARELVSIISMRGDKLDGRELRVRDASGCVVLQMALKDVIAREGAQSAFAGHVAALTKPLCSACLKMEKWRPTLK